MRAATTTSPSRSPWPNSPRASTRCCGARTGEGPVERRLVCGPLAVDLLARTATRAGEEIALHPLEFRLLELLIRSAGRVVTKTMILETVWKVDFHPQTNVVDVLVHRLRKKVDGPFEPKLLHTVRGVGYTLRLP